MAISGGSYSYSSSQMQTPYIFTQLASEQWSKLQPFWIHIWTGSVLTSFLCVAALRTPIHWMWTPWRVWTYLWDKAFSLERSPSYGILFLLSACESCTLSGYWYGPQFHKTFSSVREGDTRDGYQDECQSHAHEDSASSNSSQSVADQILTDDDDEGYANPRDFVCLLTMHFLDLA